MSLTKISGHTYFIPGPTNVGVFTTKSGYCVIVDTGLDNNAGRRLNDILNAAGLKPKIVINTHAHPDHFGANTILKSLNPGLEVWVPPFERLFIENAGLEAYSMYGAAPYREMRSNLLHAKACEVDNTLNLGVADLLDKAFQVMALPGHTLGQIGIITPDKVAFIADSLFSTEILEKYSMPFLQDIKQQLNTLETLLNLDAEHLLQSHSTGLITDLSRTVNSNKKNIQNYITMILELLEQPLTREDLLEQLTVLNDLTMDIPQYYIYLSTISAFISYLKDEGKINTAVENGKLFYYV